MPPKRKGHSTNFFYVYFKTSKTYNVKDIPYIPHLNDDDN